ncbi:uncharacterized protein LOC129899658 [Solanum dulcamara]|uniref:uncharacterized protein LOC129899658 n=1 Tax=Solanum dulcamara TaxID=45834 RepID=UPI002486A0C1|nr:uncharacterized protein LOC129899658 [Solanum dulcamara]
MSGNGRMKRVTDPLNDKVKARIVGGDLRELGYLSSGSEHSADADSDVVSPSFSGLVFGFPDDLDQNQSPENDNYDTELDESSVDFGENLPEVIFQSDTDLYRNVLCSHVYKALEVFSCLKSNKSVLRRNVMMCLRDFGYNAAICKSQWESSGGLTAGNYEFIDVKSDAVNRQTRYFVDLDFAAEFEIARPTRFYEQLSQSLPNVFVGKNEELKQILRTMSDAARRSLKSRGLHLPPWRKYRFMQNKWLGPYKRTSNIIPWTNTPTFLPPPSNQAYAVKCRSVGFETAVHGGLWLPAVTRTG